MSHYIDFNTLPGVIKAIAIIFLVILLVEKIIDKTTAKFLYK